VHEAATKLLAEHPPAVAFKCWTRVFSDWAQAERMVGLVLDGLRP
jgi:hypothetical protein